MNKLYIAYSFMHDLLNRNQLFVTWFKNEGTLGEVDYSKIIKDYDQLYEAAKARARYWANQFFTEEEIGVLRQYLKEKSGTALFVEEYSLPLEFKHSETGEEDEPYLIYSHPFNTVDIGDADNELPFQLFGNFDFHFCPPSKELPEEMIEYGHGFLKGAAETLFPEFELTDEVLEDVTEKLYERHGFYVGRNFNRV